MTVKKISELEVYGKEVNLTHVYISTVLFFSKVPAFLNIVDIAGLVKGAAEGQGLGNAFLSHIKACDALFHLCREYDKIH